MRMLVLSAVMNASALLQIDEEQLPKLRPLESIIDLIPDQREQLRVAKSYREKFLSRVVHEVITSEPPVRPAALLDVLYAKRTFNHDCCGVWCLLPYSQSSVWILSEVMVAA